MHEKELIERLRAILQAAGTSGSVPSKPVLDLLDSLENARKDTYRKIAARIDNELCGEIFRIDPSLPGHVVSVGSDAVKDIIFQELGFTEKDALELG